MAVHVRSKSSSFAQQQREITEFWIFWRMRATAAYFSLFHLELNADVAYSA